MRYLRHPYTENCTYISQCSYMTSLLECLLRGKRFTVCTEIVIILGTVRFGSRYVEAANNTNDMMLIFGKKSSVELPFSSFGDHLINILRKVN